MKKILSLGLLAALNIQIQAMEPEMIILQSNDGTDLRMPVQVAKRSETIKLLIEDAGTDNPIPLPTIDGNTLKRMVELMTSLNTLLVFNEKHQRSNPEKQIYIPRRFQSRIHKVVKDASNPEIGQLFSAANYLDIPFILNGAAAEIADRIYEEIPGSWYSANIIEKQNIVLHSAKRVQEVVLRENFGKIPRDVIEFVVKHVTYRKVGITREWSIADYIEDYGQPNLIDSYRGMGSTIKQLRFNKEGFLVQPNEAFTSLFGIKTLQEKNQIQELNLHGCFYDFNLDVQGVQHPFAALPQLRRLSMGGDKLVRLPSGFFEGAEQLEYLSLQHNGLTNLPMDIFSKLYNLRDLCLNTNLFIAFPNPERLFSNLRNLKILYLNDNPITPENLNSIRMAIRVIAPQASVHFEH
jgi:hypothetical protein